MFNVIVKNREFIIYLDSINAQKANIDKKAKKDNNTKEEKINSVRYSFSSKQEFSSLFTSYFKRHIFKNVISFFEKKDLMNNDILDSLEKELGMLNAKRIYNDVYTRTSQVINASDDTISFCPKNFIKFHLKDHKNNFKNLLYEGIIKKHHIPNQIKGNEFFKSRIDILYVVIDKDVGIKFKNKSSSELESYELEDQEQAVAHIIHLNPELTIVYDDTNLLQPEMVVCLKKYLKKKVNFLDEKFPFE